MTELQQKFLELSPRLSSAQKSALRAAIDLIESIEIDTSTDDGESYTVIGNVKTETLRILGFRLPRKPSVGDCTKCGNPVRDEEYLEGPQHICCPPEKD